NIKKLSFSLLNAPFSVRDESLTFFIHITFFVQLELQFLTYNFLKNNWLNVRSTHGQKKHQDEEKKDQ
ncbi:hypothetical protein SAMN05216357_11091, partial [Porphyromonadaceae bacterium KH3CP3RA]